MSKHNLPNRLGTPEQRFLRKINKTDYCWEWTASKNIKGYGVFSVNRKTILASRFSFSLFKGPIPDGMHVCHTCDNPSCVNPDHLWLGTLKDNMQDKMRKGRWNGGIGENHPLSTISFETVLSIRKDLETSPTVLSQKYNISRPHAGKIKQNLTRKHG